MNRPATTQLKILVERAVRPVRASTARKMQMREELLAHATAIFEQEMAKLSNEELAIDNVRHRFGNADEIARELQESVSRFSGAYSHCEALWIGRWGVSTSLGAARFAFGVAAMTALLILLTLTPVALMKPPIGGAGIFFPLSVAFATGGFTFALIFLACLLQQAIERRSWPQAIITIAFSVLTGPAIVFGLCYVNGVDVPTSVHSAMSASPLASLLLVPFAVICAAISLHREFRAQREWAELQLD